MNSIAKPLPLIAAGDVKASAGWYAQLLGADALPGHPHLGRSGLRV